MCDTLLVYVLRLLHARLLILVDLLADATLDHADLIPLGSLVVTDLVVNHFLDEIILFRLFFQMLSLLLCQGKLGHTQGLHVGSMPQVLQTDPLSGVFYLLLPGFLSKSLILEPALLLPLYNA
jgi:hypothetical protein